MTREEMMKKVVAYMKEEGCGEAPEGVDFWLAFFEVAQTEAEMDLLGDEDLPDLMKLYLAS